MVEVKDYQAYIRELEAEAKQLREEIDLLNQARRELANISLIMHFITEFSLKTNKTSMNDFILATKERLFYLLNNIGISFYLLYVYKKITNQFELVLTNLNIPSYQIMAIPSKNSILDSSDSNNIANNIPLSTFPLFSTLKNYVDEVDNFQYFNVNLVFGEETIGFLILGKEKTYKINNLTFEDVLGQIKVILENSIKNIQLYEELTAKARYDALTQLYNRAAFSEFLEKEVKRGERYKHNFCIAMVDLDNLKKMNDSNGHLYGDMVLRSFADILKAAFRQTDIIGRYGGDEFIILFIETDLHGAIIAIERLYQFLNAKNFPTSCSIGLTEFKKGDTSEEMIKRADKSLYNAKQSGKKHLEVL